MSWSNFEVLVQPPLDGAGFVAWRWPSGDVIYINRCGHFCHHSWAPDRKCCLCTTWTRLALWNSCNICRRR